MSTCDIERILAALGSIQSTLDAMREEICVSRMSPHNRLMHTLLRPVVEKELAAKYAEYRPAGAGHDADPMPS